MAVYLNYENTDVVLGEQTAPRSLPASAPFNNVSTEESLANAINLETAESGERHNQSSHIWVTGVLELVFEFDNEYEMSNVHFWNYWSETYDVDQIDLTFFNASGAVTSSVSLAPLSGGPGSSDSVPIEVEDYSIEGAPLAQTVSAVFTASNDQLDFNNIGFTGALADTEPQVPDEPTGPAGAMTESG